MKEEISQTVKFLIDHGADVNAKTAQGFTALIYASRDGFLKTVEHLITNGAEIDAQTSFGYTALMVSFELNFLRYLICNIKQAQKFFDSPHFKEIVVLKK